MPEEFREGDWVRHHSCQAPVRVVGIGTTIVVKFPNGDMQAFEPCELEKVSIANVPARMVQVGDSRQDRGGYGERFAFVTTLSLIFLIMLVLVVIATVTL